MTRFLKLVRHEDGKWKALPNETDDIAQVKDDNLKERKYAPIDPDQLLKSLDSLLSPEGGIRSIEDVPRVAGITKKFSKKLVSRCVYCNVLQATQTDILAEYLEKGGWETINVWLQYAKSSSAPSFLVEMLKLCKLLPMTLERLKENNTAKLVKSLVKHENNDVKELSNELVSKWMNIIKEKKSDAPPVEKKKKKEKDKDKHKTDDKDKKEEKSEKKTSNSKKDTAESPKTAKIKGTKRPSSEKETKKTEYYEDVKIDPEPLFPVSKKPKVDRPKTARVYQKKFRATGLEEETPLPKKIAKKSTNANVDKTAAVAAAKNALKLNSVLPDRITEKKINPDSLMAIHESVTPNKGIKLIPAKPRPAILQESASFIDAIISQPTVAVKRKKKVPPPAKVTTSPTSPTMAAPKFSFYKDTLEMNEEIKKEEDIKKEESEKENVSDTANEGSPKKEEATTESAVHIKEEPMDTNEDGGHTPPNNEEDISDQIADSEIKDEPMEERGPFDPNHVRSILSHGRRRGKKKSVKWVDDENIKEIFYFDMDETERVNVLKAQNFMDLKSIELKKEREALEKAKRQAGDRMEEMTRWWTVPILIDAPPPLIEPGCFSQEKEHERIRQQSTLQEIYFTREMIPDSPHEPDLEIVAPQEPKFIPLDEENVVGAISDYSNFVLPKVAIPEIPPPINIPSSLPNSLPPPNSIHQSIIDNINPAMNHHDPMNQHNGPMSMAAPYDPAEPLLPNMLGNPMQQPQPNMFGMGSPPVNEGVNMPPNHTEWRGPPPMEMGQPEPFFQHQRYPNMMPPDGPIGPGMMRPRMMNDMFRPPMMKGIRGMSHRPRNIHRIPCRHFLAGSCRFGIKCTFLHPGINGPPL